MKEDLIAVAGIQKSHGVFGEVKVIPDVSFLKEFLGSDLFFMDIRGRMTPFLVEHIRGNNPYYLKLEGYKSKEEAMTLHGNQLYLKVSKIESNTKIGPGNYGKLKGFTMKDENGNSLGKIEEILDMPAQQMAVLKHTSGEEKMVPIIPQFVKSIDSKQREIVLELPEGMLDL
jgi:16S rRNA processing protein RimM